MATNDREQSSTGLSQSVAGVDLYWLPLGAGGHSVRLNGRVFEAVVSRLEHRPVCDLYHSALEVRVPEGRFVIEQAPVPSGDGARRGAAAGGAVGARWAGRFRIFRYEVRRWRDGVIPDVGEAVDSPRRLTDDPACAEIYPDVVDGLENEGGVPSRLLKTDRRKAEKEGTPCRMFAGSPSGRTTRTASRWTRSPARERVA